MAPVRVSPHREKTRRLLQAISAESAAALVAEVGSGFRWMGETGGSRLPRGFEARARATAATTIRSDIIENVPAAEAYV